VQIDEGADLPAPVWRQAIEPGTHQVRFKDLRGNVVGEQEVRVEPGQTETIVVPVVPTSRK
jgi:hypothetical protein